MSLAVGNEIFEANISLRGDRQQFDVEAEAFSQVIISR